MEIRLPDAEGAAALEDDFEVDAELAGEELAAAELAAAELAAAELAAGAELDGAALGAVEAAELAAGAELAGLAFEPPPQALRTIIASPAPSAAQRWRLARCLMVGVLMSCVFSSA